MIQEKKNWTNFADWFNIPNRTLFYKELELIQILNKEKKENIYSSNKFPPKLKQHDLVITSWKLAKILRTVLSFQHFLKMTPEIHYNVNFFEKNIPTSMYNCSVFFSKCENLTTTLTTIILFTHSWWNWERGNWSMWRKTSQSKAWPASCVPSPPWWEAISHTTALSLLCIVNKTL